MQETIKGKICLICNHDHWCYCGNEDIGLCCQCDTENGAPVCWTPAYAEEGSDD